MIDDEDTDIDEKSLKPKEGSEIMHTAGMRTDSLDYDPADGDFDPNQFPTIKKKLFQAEMHAYDTYLHNINKAFRSATTISSLISLVRTGLTVNQQRRHAALEMLKADKPEEENSLVIELDSYGNPKPNRR